MHSSKSASNDRADRRSSRAGRSARRRSSRWSTRRRSGCCSSKFATILLASGLHSSKSASSIVADREEFAPPTPTLKAYSKPKRSSTRSPGRSPGNSPTSQVIPTPLHVLGRISPIFSPFFPAFCALSPSRRGGSNEPKTGTQGQETVPRAPKHQLTPGVRNASQRRGAPRSPRGAPPPVEVRRF
eukprot:COSAG04_NODE_3079_length_3189_cov_7.995469_3_plen_185_part_00